MIQRRNRGFKMTQKAKYLDGGKAAARMKALIDSVTVAPMIVRKIARWLLDTGSEVFDDDKFLADLDDALDDDAHDEAYMNVVRRQWPKATDEEILQAHNLLAAVTQTVAEHPMN
jgi:hypothetical protein